MSDPDLNNLKIVIDCQVPLYMIVVSHNAFIAHK